MRRNHKPKRSIAIKRREATSASPAPVFNACSPFSPPTYKSHHHVRRRGGGRRGKGSKVKEKAELPPHYSSPTCREFYNNTCRLINGGLISLPVLLIYVSEDDALEEEEEEDKHANVGGSYLCLLQIDSMAASWGRRAAQVVAFLALLVLAKAAAAAGGNDTAVRSGDELRKYKRIIRSQLLKINKPAIKTIQVTKKNSSGLVWLLVINFCLSKPMLCFGGGPESWRRSHRLRSDSTAAGVRPPDSARIGTSGGGSAGEA